MLTIVAIDDDPTTLLIFRHMLRAHFNVESAATAMEGIALGAELKPCLFLIDLHLPYINGLQAVEIIRSTPGIHETPILIVTANASTTAKEDLLAAGVDQMIVKPFTAQSLLETVTKVVQSSNQSHAAAVS